MTGSELQKFMTDYGLTHGDIMIMMGASQRTIYNWLSGKKIPRPIHLLIKSIEHNQTTLQFIVNEIENLEQSNKSI